MIYKGASLQTLVFLYDVLRGSGRLSAICTALMLRAYFARMEDDTVMQRLQHCTVLAG